MVAAGQLPSAASMSSSRPKLMLDEQAFQDMLEAAYTIQEHNARRRRSAQPQPACSGCGEPVSEGERFCGRCAGDQPRQGEKLQQKWASMWLKGREQGLWPEVAKIADPVTTDEDLAAPRTSTPAFSTLPLHTEAKSHPKQPSGGMADEAFPELRFDDEQVPAIVEEPEEAAQPTWLKDEPHGSTRILDVPDEEVIDLVEQAPLDRDLGTAASGAQAHLRDLRLILRFHRADLYLVAAIAISTFAMLWVLLAAPAANAHRRPQLRAWERAMISLGLAEAPEPPPRSGNPVSQVWVDPKTALYYCVGEEQFGKTTGGYSTTQRDAQLNAFEPAGRAPCD